MRPLRDSIYILDEMYHSTTEMYPDKDEEQYEIAAVEFSEEVLSLMGTDTTAVDALVEVCERHSISEEDVTTLITPKLMAVIENDSERYHLVKKTHKSHRLFPQ